MTASNSEIYTRFIKFGKVATQKEREKIVDIVKEWKIVSPDESRIDKKYIDIINSYVSDDNINSILNQQPQLKNEFIKKLFELLEKIDKNIDNKPSFSDEEKLLNKFKSLNKNEFEKVWQKREINIIFSNEENDFTYEISEDEKELKIKVFHNEIYRNKIKQINITKIQNIILNDSENQLTIKKLQKEIELIDKIRKEFLSELYKKIEELKKLLNLLNPFLVEMGDIGRLWDMSAGNWHSINFKLLEKYSQILQNKKEIQELATLLGKYRKAETELEEEEFESIEIVSRYKIEHSGKSELVGITESDDLNNLLPSEIALFSDLATESIFFKRFAEKKLQTFQYINKEKYFEEKKTTDTRQKRKEKDKGPFIIAIDTSGSMHGEPENLAKVIAFAITKTALKEKRKAFLISFSTGIETFELTDIKNSITKLIEFLQMSFYGGTDATEAVNEGINQMKSENYEKADLLIISDGIFSSLNKTTLNSVEVLKKKGNKFNALMIGSSYNEKALQFCNNIWQYDPNYDNLKDLVRKIKSNMIEYTPHNKV